MKNFLRILIVLISAILIVALVLMGICLFTQYNPKDVELASYTLKGNRHANFDDPITLVSWNIGSAISSSDEKSFKDGGKKVEPISIDTVSKNLMGIRDTLKFYNADAYFLQDVDTSSKRSGKINEVKYFNDELDLDYSFALDNKVAFYPFPWPVQGKIEAGSATYLPYQINGAHRIPLTIGESRFPFKFVSPKRAMLVTRTPIDGSSKTLVLVNINLDKKVASTNDAQFNDVVNFINDEYKKGNYVIVGGTINRLLNGNIGSKINNSNLASPSRLRNALGSDWTLAYDSSVPTVRTMNDTYNYKNNTTTNEYVVDGFICSPNVKVYNVHTIDEAFFYSDHNPVKATVKLIQ